MVGNRELIYKKAYRQALLLQYTIIRNKEAL
jgi:hypothetical protein